MNATKLVADFGIGHYRVLDRATGAQLGKVIKVERYFNIAPRGVNVVSWKAYAASGNCLRDNCGTRAEAVAVILAATKEA